MTDYIVQIKIKNGPLLRAMREEGYENAAQLARAANISCQIMGLFLGLKEAPVNKSGNFKPAVLRISTVLRRLPEDLFPPQHLRECLKKNQAEVEMSADDIMQIAAPETDPHKLMLTNLRSEKIMAALSFLPDREADVLKRRFGIGGYEEQTLENISKVYRLSPPRVRQIEQKAIRRLQARERMKKIYLHETLE